MVKVGIVSGLERLCGILDKLPGFYLDEGRLHFTRHGCWGCYPLGLATLALKLEYRWSLEEE